MARTHTIKSKANDQANATAILNGNGTEEKELKTAEKKADERFLGMSTATYVAAIENATGFAKSALHLELAVGLSMFAQHGKADLAAKKDLAIIYQQAGYKCATPNDEDYKTVNRRINVAAEFFDWLGGKDHINEWTIATSEMQSIQAIVRHLEDEFNFRGMNSVLAHIGKPVILKRDRVKAEEKKAAAEVQAGEVKQPSGAGKTEEFKAPEMSAAEKRMLEQAEQKMGEQAAAKHNRRKTDNPNTHIVKTAHLEIAVPLDIPKEELLQMATELIQLASTIVVAEEA